MEESKSIPLIINFQGKEYPINFDSSLTLENLTNLIFQHAHIPPSFQKIIFRGHNLLQNEMSKKLFELGINEGDKLLVLGTSSEEIEALQKSKEDPLLLSFEQEEAREKKRRKYQEKIEESPYISNYEVLEEFKYPPPSEALKLLKKLGSDPGIIAIMKKHNWVIRTLKEMKPEGKVGISPVCVLGLNTVFSSISFPSFLNIFYF